MIQYASKYNRNWTEEYARELLVKALDRNGLAYDIFFYEKSLGTEHCNSALCEPEIAEMLPDDEEIESDDISNQPLFTDNYFVGKFIEEILAGNTIQKKLPEENM